MAVYAVFEPPHGKLDENVFIPEGFSWAAFFFTLLWALWHRLWVVAALVFMVFAGLSVALSLRLVDPAAVSVIQFGLGILLGFEAQQLRMFSLERAGYRHVALIAAGSREAAELAYFSGLRSPEQDRKPGPARLRAEPTDTLGIFGNV
ncbi:MAG: DUF2628 domain-containing protein [Aestuariivirga sp.]|jgi:hypothetical protein|uniref:DUF2628 domain-containing protein n=1 Tax=Aestuariivirga sp. TaxID=2650926 RepID=UPI0038D0ADBC